MEQHCADWMHKCWGLKQVVLE